MPKSARILLRSRSAPLMTKMISLCSFKVMRMRHLASLSKPGSTRQACMSSNSLPPNSRYSLLSNLLMRSKIFSLCNLMYKSLSKPFFMCKPSVHRCRFSKFQSIIPHLGADCNGRQAIIFAPAQFSPNSAPFHRAGGQSFSPSAMARSAFTAGGQSSPRSAMARSAFTAGASAGAQSAGESSAKGMKRSSSCSVRETGVRRVQK